MVAKLVKGEPVAADIRRRLASQATALKHRGIHPLLVAVQVGHDKSSELYIRRQAHDCDTVGIRHRADFLPVGTTPDQLENHLRDLSADPSVTGIILQLPLPPGFDTLRMQAAIDRSKDVEGINPDNLGRIVQGRINFAPSTPLAAFTLIQSSGVDLYGKEVVVVGHSQLVGRPMALMLLEEYSTVTICHIGTKSVRDFTRRADLLVTAAGVPGLITGDMVKPGAFVVDIGINRIKKTDANGNPVLNAKGKPVWKTVGDVDFDSVYDVAGFITPVPGGVGVLTVVMLLNNIIAAAVQQHESAS